MPSDAIPIRAEHNLVATQTHPYGVNFLIIKPAQPLGTQLYLGFRVNEKMKSQHLRF